LAPSAPSDQTRFPDIGLLLSDASVFSAREVAESEPRLPLVVLSACSTGGGRFVDAEGLQGLARAFLEGGTRNLAATLWPVEDRAAQRFAVLFHSALGKGVLPSRAARDARRGLVDEGFSAADWAAFRLIGRD
jgi:CHAT domain-containing protein